MNENLGLFGAILAIIAVMGTLMFTTGREVTVNNYVVNTYLYILLAILLCTLTIIAMNKYKIGENLGGWKMFGIFILLIIVLFGMQAVGRKHVFLRNVLWVVFIVLLGVILSPIFNLAVNTDVLWKSIITVVILVGVLTFIASRVPDNYFDSWGTYLSVALLALIVFEILDMLFFDPATSGRYKVYAVVAIVIFSGFVLYDTKNIYQNGKIAEAICNDKRIDRAECVDYPTQSVGLFLDIVNLFSSIVTVQQ
ncbi:MAG: BAX inhibitor BI-1 [Harvfovirus sp.]|uniref:BAX inhibitor BI-1 n=1 Tax=Harvfovirus sp. TaxID=2487768 RepID=A0A3G5A4A3_9VIRU|nr:MAG: BAX inhibitor BI-1 [Harvfovirus sp.]